MKKKPRRRIPKNKIKLFVIFTIVLIIFISIGMVYLEPSNKTGTEEFTVKIKSPLNQTYRMQKIVLSVSSSKTAAWISNSFDDGPSVVECTGCNSYIRYDLSFTKGVHRIIVYATDNENRTAKASVVFTVDT